MTESSTAALENAAELVSDTPRVVVHLPTLRANIDRMARAAADAGVRLRPHIKTHKIGAIARMQLAAGATGIQVAKLGEALAMVEFGIADILVAYPVVGPEKVRRLAEIARRARVSVSLDSIEAAQGISAAVRAAGARVRMLVEIDTGLKRIGVQPGEEAVALAERIARLPGVELAGVLTHEGHIYTAATDRAHLERLTREACGMAVETAAAIRDRGLPAPVVSVGSSGTAAPAMRVPGVTEVRPGTYVFNDLTQVGLGAASMADVAAAVVVTVVSRPAADRAVLDGGTKTFSSDQHIAASAPRSYGQILGHPEWHFVRASEEHGVVEIRDGTGPAIGDRLVVVPNHVCPVINLHDSVVAMDESGALTDWPVDARGRLQ
jgi:D-serine deaminase-like pyridoxal phosphate-dependent protein